MATLCKHNVNIDIRDTRDRAEVASPRTQPRWDCGQDPVLFSLTVVISEVICVWSAEVICRGICRGGLYRIPPLRWNSVRNETHTWQWIIKGSNRITLTQEHRDSWKGRVLGSLVKASRRGATGLEKNKNKNKMDRFRVREKKEYEIIQNTDGKTVTILNK